MSILTLPKILDVPDKLVPIIEHLDDYRYFLIEGGRGGGKSQSIARIFLYLADKYKIRIVCGREVQNTINESVYSLMKDLIHEYQLDFTIQANKIISNATGTEINFRGFREQGRFSIQGLEGITLLWVDEAQAITKQTMDVLIPTIRKDNAKIIFTMNRHVVDDPAFDFCFNRSDCLHIKINFDENKFCTQALIHEAEECKKKSMDDYNHIWLGFPLDKSEDAVFSYEALEDTKKSVYPMRESYGYRIAGFDIARFGDDKCAAVIIQQMGALNWEVIHVEEWGQKDLNYTTGRILSIAAEHRVSKSIIDEDGIGSGPLDSIQKGRELDSFVGFRNPSISYADNREFANKRTVNTYKLRDMVNASHICIPDDELRKELMTMKYSYDHNQRKILISKDVMRTKYKIKSPNKADALIMAVSLIGEFKYKQDSQYYKMPQFSREQNLFEIAGVK